jgi:hypothetical protein
MEEEWSTELCRYSQSLLYISAKFEQRAMLEFLYIEFSNASTVRAPPCISQKRQEKWNDPE